MNKNDNDNNNNDDDEDDGKCDNNNNSDNDDGGYDDDDDGQLFTSLQLKCLKESTAARRQRGCPELGAACCIRRPLDL